MRSGMITVGGPEVAERQTVLIIDDHPLFCDALETTLAQVLPSARLSTADTLGRALEVLRTGIDPDVIILDLNLPDVAGLDGLTRLRNAAPGVPVIVVSSMSDDRIITAVRQAGAAGFVAKHSAREVFIDAVSAVQCGASYWPADYAPPSEGPSDQTEKSVIDRLADLTPQQGRILSLVCEGYLNKQIAFELSISETTVKAHVTAILRKLGAQSRTQAVRIANGVSFDAILRAEGQK